MESTKGIRIKNKIESLELIKTLGLNQFPEIFLDGLNENKLEEFLIENKVEYYAVRDKNTSLSTKHSSTVEYDKVIDYCKKIGLEKFTVNVSSFNYKESQVCAGELRITGDILEFTISNNQNYNTRDCIKDPDYNEVTSIFDKKLKRIKGLEDIIDYVYKHNLLDMIVEFTVFNRPIGIKNEKVIIWELRTDY